MRAVPEEQDMLKKHNEEIGRCPCYGVGHSALLSSYLESVRSGLNVLV